MLLPISAASADSLAADFAKPPRDARPETWFHLIGGNVAKAGLTADLEAIRDAGIDGIQLFHGQFGGPWPGVMPQITCLSPSWDEMIGHVADETKRLDLRFTMQNCPGWAMSGGPWIKPENAMRHLVWSRTDLNGGAAISQNLPKPPEIEEDWRDYRDISVIAFPTPLGDESTGLIPTRILSNRADAPWADMFAGKFDQPKTKGVMIPASSEFTWVEVSFDQMVTLRSLEFSDISTLVVRRIFDPAASIFVQAITPNGLVDVSRRAIPRSNWQDDRKLTLAFPDATATGFRITFENKTPLALNYLKLSSAARIDDWEGQAGFVLRSLDRGPRPQQDATSWIAPKSILDLTKNLDPCGKLDWQAPPGKWTVLRFGHVNTGKKNGPAPKEATGFECDKLSKAGAEAHFAGYIGRISAPGGPAGEGRLKGMVIDSWECGTQTWTSAMEAEFGKRQGYALRGWLPALAGWVVDDHLASERFLRDWRANLNEMLVVNYYGELARLGRERGLKLSFESGPGDVPTGDILQYYGVADIPMNEFWHPNDPHWGGLETKPMSPAVSAAHIYGKPRIAAEAFTNINIRWDEHPFMLKHLADRNFAHGLTHLVFHTYTHNPRLDLVPGTSFGAQIGTPFIRGQTWWQHMPHFTDYLARCGTMLEKGVPVADVLWYLGDDLDHKPRQDSPFPAGYRYDYMNADALSRRISVENGLLKTPEGVTWKILWLPNSPRLTPQTLTRLLDLIKQGATVVGLPSMQNPSLCGGAENDALFKQLITEIWGDSPAITGERSLGKGKLLWGNSLPETLLQLKIAPDVIGTSAASWCHRHLGDTDIYFIAADRLAALNANLSFRSLGIPEFWDPLTGTSKPASVYQRTGTEHTTVPINLPAAGSVFVIFRPGKPTSSFTRISRNGTKLADATDKDHVDKGIPRSIQGLRAGEVVQPWIEPAAPTFEIFSGGDQLLAWESGTYQINRSDKPPLTIDVKSPRLIPLSGPWSLSFPPNWDTPEKIELPSLQPWSALDNEPANAFSGTATYRTVINLSAPAANQRLMLDLGKVSVIAEIFVNGKSVSTQWAPPFRADITSFVKDGSNQIEVKVTSTWFNRLAYDAALPEAQRKTWTINGPKIDAPRQESGLIGPVVLRLGEVSAIKP